MKILNSAEYAALKVAASGTVKVKAHDRKIFVRPPQQIKDKCIEDFAVRFLSLLERHEVTDADRRHCAALLRLLSAATVRLRIARRA